MAASGTLQSSTEGRDARGDAAQGRTRESLRTHLRIATCYNLMMREARQLVGERWRLTLPQFDVLAELARADERGFTFVELSRLLLVTSGNLTGIVNRLAQQRLVARRPDLKDRRVIRVALTDAGRRMTDTMLPAHAGDIEKTLSFMPRAALSTLSELLGQLRDGLHVRAEGKRRQAARGGKRRRVARARRRSVRATPAGRSLTSE